MPNPVDFSSIGGKPVSAAPAPAPMDFSSIGGTRVDQAPQQQSPVQISEDDKGVGPALQNVALGWLTLPANIWSAFTDDPKDLNEFQVGQSFAGMGMGGGMALGLKRLIVDPMMREFEIAKAYDTIHKSLPADQQEKEKEFLNTDSNLHKANMHRIAGLVPLLGPLAANLEEHYLQGDKSGAVTELLANIAAAKGLDKLTKGAAAGISKIAPRTATVAGEDIPVMAGQMKGAAPIAQRVAAEPSPAIENAQQEGAAQGVKNVATDALNQQLQKMGQTTSAAESFEDAAAQTKDAAQPTFKKLDQLSNGEFSTLQNKIKMARTASRRATNMQDMQSAETALADAQQGVQDLINTHSAQFQPNELANAQSAWKDLQVLDSVHGYVEKAFSAPEDIASSSKLVDRTLDGNKLTSNLNQMVSKIPESDLTRVLGPDGLKNLYELAHLTTKTENALALKNLVGEVAGKLTKGGVGGAVGGAVAGPPGAAVGAAAGVVNNSILRYIATSPKVASLTVKALKFGTYGRAASVRFIADAVRQEMHDEGKQQDSWLLNKISDAVSSVTGK